MVVTASTKLDEWTTMAQVNLGFFTIVNMLYALINKVIQKLSEMLTSFYATHGSRRRRRWTSRWRRSSAASSS